MKVTLTFLALMLTLVSSCKTLGDRTSSKLAAEGSVQDRLKEQGELAPFPEAIPLMTKIAAMIDSTALKEQLGDSRTLQMLRERVRTSIFHVNLAFEVVEEDYPYEPPFKEPYPFRPTLETIDEAANFFRIVKTVKKFDSGLEEEIANFPYFSGGVRPG